MARRRPPVDAEAVVEAARRFLERRKGWLEPQSYRVSGHLGNLHLSASHAAGVVELARDGDADADRALRHCIFAVLEKQRPLPPPVLGYAEDLLIDGKVPKFKPARKQDLLFSRNFTITDCVQHVHELGVVVAWSPATKPPSDCACAIVSRALRQFGIDLSADRVRRIYLRWRIVGRLKK